MVTFCGYLCPQLVRQLEVTSVLISTLNKAGLLLPRAGLLLPRAGLLLPRAGLLLPRAGLLLPRAGIRCLAWLPTQHLVRAQYAFIQYVSVLGHLVISHYAAADPPRCQYASGEASASSHRCLARLEYAATRYGSNTQLSVHSMYASMWPSRLGRQVISSQERLHLPVTTLACVHICLVCFHCTGVSEIPIRSDCRGLSMPGEAMNTRLPDGLIHS